jgi:hypothetical protein
MPGSRVPVAVISLTPFVAACVTAAQKGGKCNVQPTTSLQFASLASQCARLDNTTTPPLSAAAQSCYANVSPACQTAVKRLACAHYCQQCIDTNTVLLNNFCSPLCDSVIGTCGTYVNCDDRMLAFVYLRTRTRTDADQKLF